MTIRSLLVLMSMLVFVACTDAPSGHAPDQDLGLLWVKHAAEYDALSRQAYHQAERALPGFIANKRWTALPGQTNVENLPPAIIFDVDETVVSGVELYFVTNRPESQGKSDAVRRLLGQFFEELKRSEDYLEPLVHRFTLD